MMSKNVDFSRIANISEYEQLVKPILPADVFAYFSGAAGNAHTQLWNEQAWSELRLRPHVLNDLNGLSTSVKVLGRTLRHPICVAPFAYQSLLHPLGEMATAYAAALLEAGFVLSDQSTVDSVRVASSFLREHQRGPLWYQLYWNRDKASLTEHITSIENAGFEALILTVDAPFHGVRDNERRTGFKLPAMGCTEHTTQKQVISFEDIASRAPTWEDVRWLVRQTKLPVLLKGILRPQDASTAVELGCAGVIVSNHGGRTLDTTVTTASALPAIRQALGNKHDVLVDGGLRRGTDILKAISLGANAVLVGKPFAMALGYAGPQGVAHAIRLLWDELKIALALSGCKSLDSIPSDLISSPSSRW